MTNRRTIIRVAWAAMTLALAGGGMALVPQESEPKNSDQKKQPSTEFTLRVKVTADGMDQLPSGSQLTLNGRAGCEELRRSVTLDAAGNGSFQRVPACKAQIVVLITGFDTKMASVDLAGYKDAPMRVQVTAGGPPQVN